MSGIGIVSSLVISTALLSANPKPIEVGTPLPTSKPMAQAQGGELSLADVKADVLVLIVTCNECPVARSYEARFVEFAKKHAAAGSKTMVVAINPYQSAGDTLDDMKARVAEAGFPFPYVQDKGQELTKALGAMKTPHLFVFDKARKLAYHGAFDDNWADATAVKKVYLEEVVTAILEGKPTIAPTKPEGCSIHND
jgi:hypothetical protein